MRSLSLPLRVPLPVMLLLLCVFDWVAVSGCGGAYLTPDGYTPLLYGKSAWSTFMEFPNGWKELKELINKREDPQAAKEKRSPRLSVDNHYKRSILLYANKLHCENAKGEIEEFHMEDVEGKTVTLFVHDPRESNYDPAADPPPSPTISVGSKGHLTLFQIQSETNDFPVGDWEKIFLRLKGVEGYDGNLYAAVQRPLENLTRSNTELTYRRQKGKSTIRIKNSDTEIKNESGHLAELCLWTYEAEMLFQPWDKLMARLKAEKEEEEEEKPEALPIGGT